MSSTENNEIPTDSVLKVDELLELFNYVDFCTLKQCRLVCQHWRMVIDEHRVCYRLVIGPETALDINQVPLSIVARSGIKIKKLTFIEDFGDKTYFYREKLDKLFDILGAERVLETVTDLAIDGIVEAELFFEYMQRFMNLKSFQLPIRRNNSLVENVASQTRIETVETLTIDFEYNWKYLENSQFLQFALKVFPNTREIHIILPRWGLSLNIEELVRFVEEHESKIKSVSNLNVDLKSLQKKTLLIHLHNLPNMREITNTCIQKPTQNEMNAFFDRPYQLITGLKISEPQQLDNLRFLCLMPNLRKLILFRVESTHFFGHELIELRKLEEVQLQSIQSDCNDCVETMFQSFIQIKKLRMINFNVDFSNQNIASLLRNYNLEELQSDFRYLRFFRKSTLKRIYLCDVDTLTKNSIKDLSRDCPSLETIQLIGIRDSNVKELVRSLVTHFPNIKDLKIYDDYRKEKIENLSEVFTNGNGWRLQKLQLLEIDLDHEDVLQIFRQLDFLQELRFYDLQLVTRHNYHEESVLKK